MDFRREHIGKRFFLFDFIPILELWDHSNQPKEKAVIDLLIDMNNIQNLFKYFRYVLYRTIINELSDEKVTAEQKM